MKRIYTLKDIKNFLKLKDEKVWNYLVLLSPNQTRKLNENENFKFQFSTLVMEDKTTPLIKVEINNLRFLTYTMRTNAVSSGENWYFDKNLSKEWQKYLLQVYGEEYAIVMFDWATENKNRIEQKLEEIIERYSLQQRIQVKSELDYYNSLIEMAKEILVYKSHYEV